jgi:hypothetical protein
VVRQLRVVERFHWLVPCGAPCLGASKEKHDAKWTVPIPGTRRMERLDENIGAAAVELTSDDLQEIESATSQITIHGDRYSESSQRMIDR